MIVSQNEIEAMAKRASRGAGLPWGLVEEAGKSTRWLTEHGFEGLEILLDALAFHSRMPLEEISPEFSAGLWQAPSGTLSPFCAGAMLCDRASDIADGDYLLLGSTRQPLALAAYAATAAKLTGSVLELKWWNVTMTLTGSSVEIDAGPTFPTTTTTDSVTCRAVKRHVAHPIPNNYVCNANPETWADLNAFARLTYAPATEASRLAGAGAGATDND